MSKSFQGASLIVILVTLGCWVFSLSQRHPVQWHYLTAGGVHFIMAVIINRQFVKKNYNYLGLIHIALMILFFAYAYLFL